MSNEIQCYDKDGLPKCYYYSIARYGRLCSFDGTWNPRKKDCPNFTPLEEEENKDTIGSKKNGNY